MIKLLVLLGALWLAPAGLAVERWFYVSQNLWVDQNITNLVALMQRAAQSGYTHMLVNDSKFSRLATMDAHYFKNVGIIKQTAASANLQVVPSIFPIGYSNDLFFNEPNLIEGVTSSNA